MIRVARPDDAEGCLAVYAPYVLKTAISFETEVPSDMADRIRARLKAYPWLVWDDGLIRGYAYAGPFKDGRAAYAWSAEVSVYVATDRHRRGIGRRLYQALFDVLARQGHVSAWAGISLPNPPSVALHEALGFEAVGIFPRVGFKLGRWHDVGWWRKTLSNPPAPPRVPIPFSDPSLRADCDHRSQ